MNFDEGGITNRNLLTKRDTREDEEPKIKKSVRKENEPQKFAIKKRKRKCNSKKHKLDLNTKKIIDDKVKNFEAK